MRKNIMLNDFFTFAYRWDPVIRMKFGGTSKIYGTIICAEFDIN